MVREVMEFQIRIITWWNPINDEKICSLVYSYKATNILLNFLSTLFKFIYMTTSHICRDGTPGELTNIEKKKKEKRIETNKSWDLYF